MLIPTESLQLLKAAPLHQEAAPLAAPLHQESPIQPSPSAPLALKPSSATKLAKLGVSPAWTLKNPTFDALLRHYAPSHWGLMVSDARRAYTWICPTVGALADLYGKPCPAMWMDEQVTHLFLTSQSRDAGQAAAQVETFVDSFVGVTARYKLTEVMLFLARYKAGVYGGATFAFDARLVGQTFHREFLPDRQRELARIEEERIAAEQQEERTLRAQHSLSREVFEGLSDNTPIMLRLRINPRLTSEQLHRLTTALRLPLSEKLTDALVAREPIEACIPKRELESIVRLASAGWVEVKDSWLGGDAS